MIRNRGFLGILPVLLFILLLNLAFPAKSSAGMVFEFETGSAFTSYNDVRIPGDTGTLFSIQDDLNPNASFYFRLRATWEINKDHALSVLIAPLRFDASGIAPKAIQFYEKTFSAGEMLEAKYRFDSYRLTYRYTLVDDPTFQFKLGLTAKIRDAAISVRGETAESERVNTGFVPAHQFLPAVVPGRRASLLLDGDAGRTPGSGRGHSSRDPVRSRRKVFLPRRLACCRGRRDNDKVYNFTWVNYLSLAAGIRL